MSDLSNPNVNSYGECLSPCTEQLLAGSFPTGGKPTTVGLGTERKPTIISNVTKPFPNCHFFILICSLGSMRQAVLEIYLPTALFPPSSAAAVHGQPRVRRPRPGHAPRMSMARTKASACTAHIKAMASETFGLRGRVYEGVTDIKIPAGLELWL